MKVRNSSLVLFFLAGGTALAFWLGLRTRVQEPVHGGRPLRHWVDHLSGKDFGESYDALRAIGPAAVPWLLAEVRAAHGLRRRVSLAVWPHLPERFQRSLRRPAPPPAVDETVSHALGLLDSKGLPPLLSALENDKASVRRVVVLAISKMLLTESSLAQALPAIIRLVSASEEPVRIAALGLLEKMGTQAHAAVPALIGALQNENDLTGAESGLASRQLAVRVLGRIGKKAASAVPTLSSLTRVADRDLRVHAMIALWRITGNTELAAPLTYELNLNEPSSSHDILVALSEMGPAAKGAVPVLLETLETPDRAPASHPSFIPALNALRKIDRREAARIGQLQEEAWASAMVRRRYDRLELLKRQRQAATGEFE